MDSYSISACKIESCERLNNTYPISTSGLLCLSTVCDGKFLKHNAASSDDLTQFKYG